MMDINLIREIIDLIRDTDVTEVFYEKDGQRIKIKRGGASPQEKPAASFVPPASVQAAPQEPDNAITIKSPMVGTFYRSPSPETSPFVNLGDRVKKGQVLCVVEAMKLMNEIESESDGTIKKIMVENGQPIEYGEALFLLDPA